jgi:HK97 gp10 family phage protein
MPAKIGVVGLDEINKILDQLVPKHARNLSKSVIHGLASETTKEAKKRVPTDKGTLKRAIKAKRRRGKPNQPVSDVIVEHGNSVKNDAFYWHMVEYGTGGNSPQPEQPFLRPAKDLIHANMPRILDEQFTKKLAALVRREQKKARKI